MAARGVEENVRWARVADWYSARGACRGRDVMGVGVSRVPPAASEAGLCRLKLSASHHPCTPRHGHGCVPVGRSNPSLFPPPWWATNSPCNSDTRANAPCEAPAAPRTGLASLYPAPTTVLLPRQVISRKLLQVPMLIVHPHPRMMSTATSWSPSVVRSTRKALRAVPPTSWRPSATT